ncbi:MAG: PAS domain S-box protein, partial [Bacteroidota bacterium]
STADAGTHQVVRQAHDFFVESISPIEMTHRGFLDAINSLRSSEERYRTLVESARDVIYTLSPQATITSLNPAFEMITGWPSREWLGKSFIPLVHPDDLPLALETFNRVIHGESPPTFELRILTKGSDYLTGEFTTTPQLRDGKVVGTLGVARDITDRKKAEERIRQSEERFRLISENAGDLIVVVNLEGLREYNSPSYEPLLGDPKSLKGTDSFKDIHPEDRERVKSLFFDTVRTGVGRRAEYRMITRTGEVRYIESQGNLIRDNEDRPLKVLVVSRDITERKKAHEQLKTSEMRLMRAEQIAHLGSWDWDIPGNKVTWSEEMYRTYGLKPNAFEATYEGFLEYVHPDDREAVKKVISEAYRTKQQFQFEHRIVLPDGSVRTLEARGEVVVDEKGNPVKMFGSGQDITLWKEANRALNALAKRVVDAQEEERQRIARELHDDICQRLTGMKFIVDDFLVDIPKQNRKAQQRIKSTKKQIDQLIVEVRRMSSNLRPTALDDFGLAVAVRRLCEEIQKIHKMRIVFAGDGLVRKHYNNRVEIALYRIVQEALFNS